MNSMYILVHTAIIFVAGYESAFTTNSNLSFAVDLIAMSVAATFVYSYMFRKTGNNVLYVLLYWYSAFVLLWKYPVYNDSRHGPK